MLCYFLQKLSKITKRVYRRDSYKYNGISKTRHFSKDSDFKIVLLRAEENTKQYYLTKSKKHSLMNNNKCFLPVSIHS